MSFRVPIFRPFSATAGLRPSGGHRRRYAAASLTAWGLVILGPALAAQAHVHVHPDSTVAGSDAELAFTVPSESPSASTTMLSITLPQDHPFPEISARVTPGWTVKITEDALPKPVVLDGTTLTKAAHVVTWTATAGSAIPPEQYQDFYLSVGPLPDSGDVMFTARQTYSDGSVVAWDEPAVAGGEEPEHPAPSFTVTTASDITAPDAAADSSDEETASSTDGFSRLLGGAGLLAGLGAIGLMVARRSPRRPAQPSGDEEQTLDMSSAGAVRSSS